MRRILTLLPLALMALSLSSQAQEKSGKITGTVIDGSSKIIESATISLKQASDSALVKMGVADKTGLFSFEQVAEGSYFVTISAVGHQVGFSEKFSISSENPVVKLKTIELVPVAKAVGGVTVVAKKPFIEQKAGKMVLNVDASPSNTGINALELLEKSPGVTVDNDGNISLKGKQGVLILIDGKPTYMSGADLTALLKNMQSSNLDQIEIMTNPPAKYDAAGNSGIINIKTKKGIVKGMNGNANLGYTQGLYPRLNGGVNLNYRNNKLNLFGGYNGGRYEGYNLLDIDRKFYEADKVTIAGTADQISRPYWKGQYHTIKTGLDYYFSKKDVAGIVVNTNWGNGSENPTSDSYVRNADGTINYKLNSFGDNTRKNLNITSNFNYKHTFDSTGREITADLDHAYYSNKRTTQLNTQSYDALNNKIGNLVILAGDIPSEINIYSGKLDYVHPFKKGLKMEAGMKTSYVKTDNRVDYLRSNGSGWNVDDRSNHFLYNETINAAYLIFSKSSKKWELTAGLRLENTISKGHQISNDSSFKRDYTNLFPNLGVGFTANEKNQLNFSYSRRISRPDYDDLNPFTFFLDSLTYGQGNPYLQPQFTHNVEISHTYNKFLTTTLNYTQTDDIITELLKQDTEKKVTYQTRDNFSSMKQFGLAVMANIPVRKWWSSNVYVNVYNNHYKGLYQTDPIDVRYTAFTANMNNNFTIGKGWGAELGGWYRGKSPEGLLVADPMGSLNAGITKQIFKKKGSLKLGIRDILYTSQFSGYAKYSDVDVVIGARRDSRQVTLNFNYRFGKSNIAPERRRKGGASDEQNRVKTGN